MKERSLVHARRNGDGDHIGAISDDEPPAPRAMQTATGSSASGTPRTRLVALDGLRFLAAISVVVFHYVAVAANDKDMPIWGRPADQVFGDSAFLAASYGWVGVPLFFMISGFVICMTSWGRTLGGFATSRFVRLFPAFWVCVLLTTTVATLYPHVFEPLPIRGFLANLTMMQDPLGVPRADEAYWTLWLEMKFYFLFAAVVWLGLTYRRVVAFCLIWSIASVWAGELKQPWLNAILMPRYSHYFIAGIALYLVYRFGRHPVPWIIVGFSWLLAMHFYAVNPWQREHGEPYMLASALVTACYGVMILLALGWFNRIRWRSLTALGATTYPLYLLHYVIGFSVIHYLNRKLTVPPVFVLLGVIAAMVVLAWLVHHLIERPVASRLNKALARPIRAVGPTAPMAAGQTLVTQLSRIPRDHAGQHVESDPRPAR